jgi:glycosyltransferase involved in cell wall biosynthesis
MHIAMVGRYPSPGRQAVGGVEVAVKRLVEALVAAGLRLSVVAPGDPATLEEDRLSVRFTPEDSRLGLLTRLRVWRSGARAILAELEPDVIHGQSLIACALAATDDPRGLPTVVTVHGNVLQDVLARRNGGAARLRRAAVKRLAVEAVSRADAVVSVHPDWRLNVPTAVRKFVHIPNIVDERFFDLPRRPEAGRVLFCGGNREVKGWDLLAKAWPDVTSTMPGATLELCGWPAEATIEPFGDTGTVRVTTDGSLEAVLAASSRASVLVVPSRFDLAPIVLAEAWAARVPVVATAVGGIPDLARDAARLVEPSSPHALADALVETLAGSDVSSLVETGRERAEAHRASAVATSHLRLYESFASA